MPEVTDPEVLAFIARTEEYYPTDANLATMAENRHIYDAMCAAFRKQRPENVEAADAAVFATGPDRQIPIRRYHRKEAPKKALVLYSHGGGYAVGGLESHDDVCAEICARTGCDVIATDYRLAPEHIFPAQIDDVSAVYRSVLKEGMPIIVVGDSAGGGLSAALCLRAKRLSWPQPAGQVLVYPGLGGHVRALASYVENAQAPMLRTIDVEHYSSVLTGGRSFSQIGDPELAPLMAMDFSGLAPALAISADIDPLRDDARLYAEKLNQAGVAAIWRNEEQLVHGFQRGRHISRRIAASFTAVCDAICAMAREG
jgi:acetyl esterase